jgi:hypothetical protein
MQVAAASLLLYCCFTAALLLLYSCSTAALLLSAKCERNTDRPHSYQAGYLLTMNIKGIEPQNRLHAGPKLVLEVTGACSFVVQGHVPKKISGMPLNTFFGRSKVCMLCWL